MGNIRDYQDAGKPLCRKRKQNERIKGGWLTSTPSNALKVKADNLYIDVKGGENTFDPLLQTKICPSGF